jgi:hypothetical protein
VKSNDMRFCPKCGSINAIPSEIDFSGAAIGLAGADSARGFFQCGECGFKGIFPITDEKGLMEFRKELRKKNPRI